MNHIALQCQQLQVHIHQQKILHDLNLNIRQGRWTCVVGPNGCGKSTLLKALSGLIDYKGQVLMADLSLSQWHSKNLAQHRAWLGQDESSNDDLTVYDVVMLGRLPHQSWLQGANPKDHQHVSDALKKMHAWDWRERPLGQLSGGERQRVLLARVWASDASVFLMDEPISNLDVPHQADWISSVQDVVKHGATVVSVLHDLTLSLLADEVVVMQNGIIVHHGSSQDTATHQAMTEVFDGRIQIVSHNGQTLALIKNAIQI